MLLLLFKVGSQHYAIEAKKVLQVLSSSGLQRSENFSLKSDTSNAQVGLLQWQVDQTVVFIPVIDLSQLLTSVPCAMTIGTRIMVIQDGTDRLWGLMASSMVQTWTIDDDLWIESETPQILMRDQTLIYGLSADQLLAQVRNSCDQFRVRTVAVERDRAASQN